MRLELIADLETGDDREGMETKLTYFSQYSIECTWVEVTSNTTVEVVIYHWVSEAS